MKTQLDKIRYAAICEKLEVNNATEDDNTYRKR
jgi:hypothetical protein